MRYCKKCGKRVAKGIKFCQYCGEKIEQEAAGKENRKKRIIFVIILVAICLLFISIYYVKNGRKQEMGTSLSDSVVIEDEKKETQNFGNPRVNIEYEKNLYALDLKKETASLERLGSKIIHKFVEYGGKSYAVTKIEDNACLYEMIGSIGLNTFEIEDNKLEGKLEIPNTVIRIGDQAF